MLKQVEITERNTSLNCKVISNLALINLNELLTTQINNVL